jgi:hypothetical protein
MSTIQTEAEDTVARVAAVKAAAGRGHEASPHEMPLIQS